MKYYVYTHSIDGVVFYVGCSWLRARWKGHRSQHERAYAVSKRTIYWKEYVQGRSFDVQIIKYVETKDILLQEEEKLIRQHGLRCDGTGTLVNKGYGGRSNWGRRLHRNIPIEQLNLDGSIVRVWPNPAEIQIQTGWLKTNVVKCCRNAQITAYGYKWKYAMKVA